MESRWNFHCGIYLSLFQRHKVTCQLIIKYLNFLCNKSSSMVINCVCENYMTPFVKASLAFWLFTERLTSFTNIEQHKQFSLLDKKSKNLRLLLVPMHTFRASRKKVMWWSLKLLFKWWRCTDRNRESKGLLLLVSKSMTENQNILLDLSFVLLDYL